VAGLARTAWSVVQHREFLLLAVAMGANFAALMSFIGAAPAVVEDHWHLRRLSLRISSSPSLADSSRRVDFRHMAGRYTYAQQSHLGFLLAMTGSGLMTLLHASFTAPPILLQQSSSRSLRSECSSQVPH